MVKGSESVQDRCRMGRDKRGKEGEEGEEGNGEITEKEEMEGGRKEVQGRKGWLALPHRLHGLHIQSVKARGKTHHTNNNISLI